MLASCGNGVIARTHDSMGASTGAGGSGTGGAGGGGTGGTGTPGPRCNQSRPGAPMLRRLTRQELGNTVSDVFPEIANDWGGVQLGPDPSAKTGFANDASTLIVGDNVATKWLATAEDVAKLVIDDGRLATILPCASSGANAACAARFIDEYGPRLFRRPLTADEQSTYGAYHASVASRSNFKMGLKWLIVAMLESPHAMYRSELGEPPAGGYVAGRSYPLTQDQIAAELAYTYGGSTPDDTLRGKASAGMLSAPDVLVGEARRLLQTPRGQDIVREFFREWLGYRTVIDKVKTTTKDFDLVKGAMAEETARFIDQVVVTDKGGVKDLLLSPFTVVNGPLLGFYGIGPASSADYALVRRPESMSIGILAQGSLLAGNAQTNRSSPTKRGLLLFEKLFCNERPQVPPNVPMLDTSAPPGAAQTTRERFEKLHASSDFCKSCHLRFDPIGFAFEHFDEVGRYRATENGVAIDATGKVTRIDEHGDTVTAISFDGLTDLATQAAALPAVTDCVSGYLTTYAYGGVIDCPAEEQRKALAEGKYGIVEYLVQIAGAPHFTTRAP
jgi:hypothetical protein